MGFQEMHREPPENQGKIHALVNKHLMWTLPKDLNFLIPSGTEMTPVQFQAEAVTSFFDYFLKLQLQR